MQNAGQYHTYTRYQLVAESKEVVKSHKGNLLKTKHNNLQSKNDKARFVS